MRLDVQQAPNRDQRPGEWRQLLEKAKQPARTDNPKKLSLAKIKQVDALFQPRFDSIAFAPGRSDGHTAYLARVLRGGADLDPVKVIAFGDEWFLIDGHHRLRAYADMGRTKSIPVEVLHSELTGEARIDWAIAESAVDNKKNRLPMSDADKMDAAWAAVARGVALTIQETANQFGVSPRSVANMRKAAGKLTKARVNLATIHSWGRAQREVRIAEGDDRDSGAFDYDAERKQVAAKKLKGVMQMRLRPRLLAEVLESYEPGIVDMMALSLAAWRRENEAEELDDLDF